MAAMSERVELLNLCGADDPVHRMKHLALIRHLPEIDFVAPVEEAPPPFAVRFISSETIEAAACCR